MFCPKKTMESGKWFGISDKTSLKTTNVTCSNVVHLIHFHFILLETREKINAKHGKGNL